MVVITIKPIVRERFHPFNPGLQQLTYKIPPNNPDWYVCMLITCSLDDCTYSMFAYLYPCLLAYMFD